MRGKADDSASVLAPYVQFGYAGSIDPHVQPPDAGAIDVALAALCAPRFSSASKEADTDVSVRRMFTAKPLERFVVERYQMLVVLHRVVDAQRSCAADILDEILDERGHLQVVADGVDHGDALRRREVVLRGNHTHEGNVRA